MLFDALLAPAWHLSLGPIRPTPQDMGLGDVAPRTRAASEIRRARQAMNLLTHFGCITSGDGLRFRRRRRRPRRPLVVRDGRC